MKEYNSLSKHIQHKIDESYSVNEAFEGIKKFFGSFGAIMAIMSPKENAITAELKKNMQTSRDNIKKRLEQLKSSKETAALEKIKASFAAKERQLDLRNLDKVNRNKALANKFKRMGATMKKTTARFTDAELSAWEKRMDDDYMALSGQSLPEGVEKAKQLMTTILRDENGKLRTMDEMKVFIDGKGSGTWAALNDAMGEHMSSIEDAMKHPDFQEVVEQWGDSAQKAEELQGLKTDLTNEETAYKNKKEAVKKAKELNAAAKEKADKISSMKSEKENLPDVSNKNNEDIKQALKDSVSSLETKLVGSDDKNATIIAHLKSMGLPSDMISELESDITNLSIDSIKSKIDSLTAENITDIKQSISSKRNELDNDISVAEEEFNSMPYPAKKDHAGNSSADLDNTTKSILNTYEGMSQDERDICGENEEKATAFEKDLKTRRSEVEKQINEIETSEKNREKAAQLVHQEMNSNSSYEDFKDAIDNATQELAPGEIIKDGKVGYMDYTKDPAEFVKKPDNMDVDEKEEYTKKAQQSLALSPVPSEEGQKKVEKKDGKYYIDGVEETDKEKVKKQLITNASIANQKMDIIKAKEDIKTKIVSLSSKSKEEIQKELKDMPESERKAIESALSNPKEFFKGCDDVNGLQKEIKVALEKEDAKDFIDAMQVDAEKFGINKTETTPQDPPTDIEELDADDIEDGFEIKDKNDDNIKYYKRDGKFYMKDGEEEVEIDFNEWKKEIDKHTDWEDNLDDLEDEDENDGQDENKKRQDPHKVWKQRTYKRGNKSFKTKSYYNKKGNSISKEEFQEKVKAYNRHKESHEDLYESSLSKYIANLLEHKHINMRKLSDFINEAKAPNIY